MSKSVYVYGDYGYDKMGKRIRKRFGGATREEALLRKAEYERERAIGLHKMSDKLTVREWIDIWQRNYCTRLHGRNQISYNTYLQRLNDEIGNMRMNDVRNIHLHRCLEGMDGMSKSSITKYRMVIRQVFSRAKQNKVIPDDPSEYVDMPEGTAGGHRALEAWEIDHIIANWSKVRSGLWVMIMMLAGLRRGELIALDWDCIDMKKRTITVRRAAEILSNAPNVKPLTKTEAGMRTVPICTPLYAALDAVPLFMRRGAVCHGSNGKRLTDSAFKRGMDTFNKVMEQLLNGEEPDPHVRYSDMPHSALRQFFRVRAHDLRYTFATLIYESGIDTKSAMFYLGHADIRMTMNLYTQLSTEHENTVRAQAIDFLDTRLGDLSKPANA